MDETRIQILIPTYNNIDEIDITLDSIWKQNYICQNIYITVIDFGSTDGTYEKILNYSRERFGVYYKPFQKNWKQRISDAARILEHIQLDASYLFSIVMYPGEIMYPDCIRILVKKYKKYYRLNPVMVLCESDILMKDGKIHKQKPLFDKDCLIEGYKNMEVYVNKDYKHQIFSITQNFAKERRRDSYDINEGRVWSKLIRRNIGRVAVYIRESLVCTKRIEYEDEVQEILCRWALYKDVIRKMATTYGYSFDGNFVQKANETLAKYALWRSFCLYQKGEDRKNIEDCFLLSEIIAPNIKKKDIYFQMKQLIERKNVRSETQIKQYFDEI